MAQLLTITGRRLVLVLGLVTLWLLLSGYWNEATLIGFGAFSVALSVWFADRAGTVDREGVPTSLFPRVLRYMAALLLEIGKANIAVTREVLRPQIKLAPKMFRVAANQPTDLTRVIFANSVTLTPGTLTVDVREDSLLIHALDESFADIDGIGAMGAKASRLEERSSR